MPTGFVTDPFFLRHFTGYAHPESAARLESITAHLAAGGLLEKLVAIPGSDIGTAWIERIHPRSHIERVREACARAPASLDADTTVSTDSFDAACRAVGGTLAACDAIVAGTLRNAFCALRPPGHHAEPERSMGFCLFNTIAVAARYMQERHAAERLFILDWDVHHGNGTQAAFYDDPTVYFCSIHQSPLYPGSGAAQERGGGSGEGTTLNFPLPPGSGDAAFLRILEDYVFPELDEYHPDVILVSAGFDAHRDDPLANLMLTDDCFATMTARLLEHADRLCGGRVLSLLEGGYDLDALGRCAERHVRELCCA